MLTLLTIPPYLEIYIDLHIRRNVDSFRYNHRGAAFIYGIVCVPANMIYIGSTWDSPRRFRQHLITGHGSNPALQAAIQLHGLRSLQLVVFNYIRLESLTLAERKAAILGLEQQYINLVPLHQQYNLINSKL